MDGVAVVAVGGYGRAELCPASDLDVVLIHRARRDIATIAERLWYPIWDSKLDLDHSVRTVKEAVAVADRDLKAALGLLDCRHVAGDAELTSQLARRSEEQWRQRARRWLPALRYAVDERHERFGEVAFLLEPELKEGRGGLRDATQLRSISAAVEILSEEDLDVAEPHELLLEARVELHRRTGRAEDRLLLEEQDEVARAVELSDADALMTHIAAAGRHIAWVSDDTWRRVQSWLEGPKRRTAATADLHLGPGLLVRDGEVELSGAARPGEDPSLLLRAATGAAFSGIPLSRAALRRLAAEAIEPSDPWPAEARNAFAALLGAGHNALAVLESLDRYNLVVRFLPEWVAVRNRPQRNAVHRFTVDRHLLETAAQAAAMTRDVARPDLLLLAAFLHDIGKGYDGDHVEVGAQLARTIATRMGFGPDDVVEIVKLVRNHLLLPAVATSRDLNDPSTINAVARVIEDHDTLELLAALAKADGLATSEFAWNPWREELVDRLVGRVASLLKGQEPEDDVDPLVTDHTALGLRAGGELLVETHGSLVKVVAPDRRGLFAKVVGLLTLHGQNVRSARATSSDNGLALDVFDIEPTFDRPLDASQLEADLRKALRGGISLEARIADRTRAYAARRRPTAAQPAKPRVVIHDDVSKYATVVEVRAPDGVGVLYRIASAVAELQLDIRHARIATLGHEVVDTFYVCDADGQKLADEELLRELEAAILSRLSRANV